MIAAFPLLNGPELLKDAFNGPELLKIELLSYGY
jgi:hypothetical protein